ncbi:hypothetical protein CC85DRAFT_141024 [Cutaneotrichosporon oleaginosum]|uniref:Uncharacterized protein n=1 Tax=Cutaneotrichosporon oleaginosum TaxID=879819 RepID=A0A0J1AZQ2_9TREE|nr:uncharacterized protein CC85DRAFT_141024 [Cutaneotrichosporon oleaginosum]KLT40814.1 hypothetical protein CC85DRAFT_141024 [Cutaneotrichosporon oleaginosum]TXT11874.1 hypothetical protein COLE_02284 [Cutaneotrichosporon oleaginosum]
MTHDWSMPILPDPAELMIASILALAAPGLALTRPSTPTQGDSTPPRSLHNATGRRPGLFPCRHWVTHECRHSLGLLALSGAHNLKRRRRRPRCIARRASNNGQWQRTAQRDGLNCCTARRYLHDCGGEAEEAAGRWLEIY